VSITVLIATVLGVVAESMGVSCELVSPRLAGLTVCSKAGTFEKKAPDPTLEGAALPTKLDLGTLWFGKSTMGCLVMVLVKPRRLLTAIISSIAEGRKAAIVITVRWAVGVAETGRRDWLTMTGLICVCAGVGRWRAVCITTTSASWLETKDIDFTEIHNTWQIVDWKVETPFDWLRKRHALTIHLHSVTYTDDLESTCGRSAQRMKETIQDWPLSKSTSEFTERGFCFLSESDQVAPSG
jgi:hypothetical protein